MKSNCSCDQNEARKGIMGVELLDLIRQRDEKQAEHNYGIVPADRYVSTIQDCVGSDLCYRYASKGNTSFSDVLNKAARTLTYNNPDTTVSAGLDQVQFNSEVKGAVVPSSISDDGIEVPKNSLMVFKHVLTSTRKDRDGDLLHSDGARLDPDMLLLWQHVHTLPIGKCLGIASQNKNKLSVYSAIVDINDLAHDAAVMVANKMGRFSHGFRALDFEKMKEEGGKTTAGPGYEVLKYEVMEESLVSVPSNTDSVTEEVIVDLVEGKKLKSGLMKKIGENYREKMPLKVPVAIDLKLTVDGKEVDNGRIEAKGQGSEWECEYCGARKGEECACPPAKENGKSSGSDEGGVEKASDEKINCSKCGSKIEDGVCEKCGNAIDGNGKEVSTSLEEKAGRTLSAKNIAALREIRGYVKEIGEREFALTRRGRGYCDKCMKMLDSMIGDDHDHDEERAVDGLTAKELLAGFIAGSTLSERRLAKSILNRLDEDEKKEQMAEEMGRFFGR